jgi:hypothetical protein
VFHLGDIGSDADDADCPLLNAAEGGAGGATTPGLTHKQYSGLPNCLMFLTLSRAGKSSSGSPSPTTIYSHRQSLIDISICYLHAASTRSIRGHGTAEPE